MDEFRILHLSDLHFARRARVIHYRVRARALPSLGRGEPGAVFQPASHNPDMVEQAARLAYEYGDGLDLVLITGDLATTGALRDLQCAHGFVDNQPVTAWFDQTGHPTLRGAGVPVRLLPGNHDRYKNAALLPGGTTFDEVFAKYWRVRQGVQNQIVLRGRGSGEILAILAADFTLASCVHADLWLLPLFACQGQGRVYGYLTRGLREQTTQLQARYPGAAVVWAVHFAPCYPKICPLVRLIRSKALLQAAERSGVSYILCGHTHRPLTYTHRRYRGVTVLCSGTATSAEARANNTIHLRTFSVDKGAVTGVHGQDFLWNERTATFERV